MIDVLVVGAGPTGLAVAALVTAHGGAVRIVERRTGPQESRAYVVQPRTLEVLAPLGLAEPLLARGDRSAEGRIHAGRRTITGTLAAASGVDSPYPFLLSIPQATVEEVLEDHLRTRGVDVEHGVELVALEQRPDAVACTLRGPDGPFHLDAGHVVGCDGVDSTVRAEAGIAFPTRPYRAVIVLADVRAVGGLVPGLLHAFVGAPGLLFLFPTPGEEPRWRLLAVHPGDRSPADLAALQDLTDRFTGGGLELRDPTSLRQLRLRRGQAERYRQGRILLAGDAAHVHSPAGAQGMNTGLQDAANLGWKLAAVARGVADPALLGSYEAERWPVARRVRQLTDLAFLGEAGDLPPLRWGRRFVLPLALPFVDGRRLPAPAFRLLGGLTIGYRGSGLVADDHPRPPRGPRAGDRLPDARAVIDGRDTTLHAVLHPPGHHLLWCGPPAPAEAAAFDAVVEGLPVALRTHHLEGPPALLHHLGAQPVAQYLVRPDGYLAFRSAAPDRTRAVAHLRRSLDHPGPLPAGRHRSTGPRALVRAGAEALARRAPNPGSRR